MRPRPFSRGNPPVRKQAAIIPPSFNEAATFQSRKCLSPGSSLSGITSFNEAATFQSRKCTSMSEVNVSGAMLQ